MTHKDIEELVRSAPRAVPSRELRDRVLAAAQVGAEPVTWSDRVWYSRTWRVAAVLALLAIVGLDRVSDPARDAGREPARAEAQVIEDVGRQLGLPPADAAALVRRELSSAARFRQPGVSVEALLDEFTTEGGGL